jgi:hypothetical protein
VPDGYLLAVDGLNCALPAGKGFFEVDFYGVSNVVTVTLEERVCFLRWTVSCFWYEACIIMTSLPLPR